MRNEKITKENKILYLYLIKIIMNYYISNSNKISKIETKLEYTRYSKFAKELIENIETNISLNFLEYFIPLRLLKDITEKLFPLKKIKHILTNVEYHLFNYTLKENYINGFYSIRTLKQQNEFAKKYIHFDYSTKKIKTLKDI